MRMGIPIGMGIAFGLLLGMGMPITSYVKILFLASCSDRRMTNKIY